MAKSKQRTVLGKGKFLRLVRDGRWEFAERVNARGGVAIVAVTDEREYILAQVLNSWHNEDAVVRLKAHD